MYYYIMPNGDGTQYVASMTPPSGTFEMLTQEEYEAAIERLAAGTDETVLIGQEETND